MDYKTYHFSAKELCMQLVYYGILDGTISFLFYRSWVAFLLLVPGAWFFIKEQKKIRIRKRKQILCQEFLCGMQAVSASLCAGYSIEHAFEEGLLEVKKIYHDNALIVKEFTVIVNGLKVNLTPEQLLLDLAKRSGERDIENFSQVFASAKRSGGDLLAIIRNTVAAIYQKEETRQEIEVCLSAKRMEQKVMSLVPCFILLYVGIGSPEFLDVLYHNPEGISIMSICLILYLAAWFLGRKIITIEV